MSVLCAELTYLNRLLRSCSIHVDIVAVDRGWRQGKVLHHHHHREMAEVGNWFFAGRPRGFPAISISGSNLGAVFCPWSQNPFPIRTKPQLPSVIIDSVTQIHTFAEKEGPILVPIWNIYSVLRHPGQSRLIPFVHRWWSRWLRFPSQISQKGIKAPKCNLYLFGIPGKKKWELWGGISAALLFCFVFFCCRSPAA